MALLAAAPSSACTVAAPFRPVPVTSGTPLVLVVTADAATRLARSEALAAIGLRVVAVGERRAAREALTLNIACVVLDRSALAIDALALVDELYRGDDAPRMVLVARGATDRERVKGLVAGADDVVPSTVSVDELVARVCRLVVPVSAPTTLMRRLVVGRVSIDQDRRSVQADGSDVNLSPMQYEILVTLATSDGEAVALRVLMAIPSS